MKKQILDACCGSRMFWFDRAHANAVYVDNRAGDFTVPDVSSKGGQRTITIAPDVVADFRSLPFCDGAFNLVIFDPPHLLRNGSKSWMGLKYGTLPRVDWQTFLQAGFAECWRVLAAGGTLVFKWSDTDIPLRDILPLFQVSPVIGHRSGKRGGTHWLLFYKAIEA